MRIESIRLKNFKVFRDVHIKDIPPFLVVVGANGSGKSTLAQAVLGLSATRSALLTAPMAVVSGMLAPLVGKLVDRYPPQPIVGSGFSALAIGLTWLSFGLTPSTPLWQLVLPFIAMGIGMAFIWAPLAATATRNLPPRLAGAGSGVYNATRQVGSVLGSAGMAAYMTSRISAEMPSGGRPPTATLSSAPTICVPRSVRPGERMPWSCCRGGSIAPRFRRCSDRAAQGRRFAFGESGRMPGR